MRVSSGLGWALPAVDWGGILSAGTNAALQMAQVRNQIKLQTAQQNTIRAQQAADNAKFIAEQKALQQAMQGGVLAPSIAPQAGVNPAAATAQHYAVRPTAGAIPEWVIPATAAGVGVALLAVLLRRTK